ncbi:MAG: RND transporter [Lutimaribacter sp.]|jgi:hypothetical protein
MRFLDRISWSVALVLAVFLGAAPITPEPHLVEKLRMLVQGQLVRPLDMFDLAMHGAPIVLLVLKAWRSFGARGA